MVCRNEYKEIGRNSLAFTDCDILSAMFIHTRRVSQCNSEGNKHFREVVF